MSLTLQLDSSLRNVDLSERIDMIETPCSKLGGLWLDEDSVNTDFEDEIQILESKNEILPDPYDLSTESSYSSSEIPSDYSFYIGPLMDGLFLNVDDTGIPLPPPDIPPHAIIPIPPSVEPEISIAADVLPDDSPICVICYTQRPFDSMVLLPCCSESYCVTCLTSHVKAQYEEGRAIIPCLFCDEKLPKSIVFEHLGEISTKKFTYMLVNASGKRNVKACSQCFHIIERTEKDVKKMKRARSNKNSTLSRTTCTSCKSDFCFYCAAPCHEGVSCVGFQKGDGLFKDWMKKRNGNQANAHKCPKCKVPIQRISGCPNMTCSKCKTNWCYDCGKRKVHTGIFGGHESRWSIFGCDRYKYTKGLAYTKMVRSSIFASQIGLFSIAALALTPIFLAIGPGLLIFGVPTLIGGILYYMMIR